MKSPFHRVHQNTTTFILWRRSALFYAFKDACFVVLVTDVRGSLTSRLRETRFSVENTQY